jgi:zinc transport system substrate-binding protein
MKNRLHIIALLILLSLPCQAAASPVVVAATGWAAAFARAAGAEDVLVIAPENLQHPPDYDPKPSDLLRLRDADFIVLGGFEGFAQRLRDSAGGKASRGAAAQQPRGHSGGGSAPGGDVRDP